MHHTFSDTKFPRGSCDIVTLADETPTFRSRKRPETPYPNRPSHKQGSDIHSMSEVTDASTMLTTVNLQQFPTMPR
jgi:hypothetical protein